MQSDQTTHWKVSYGTDQQYYITHWNQRQKYHLEKGYPA